MIMLIGMIYDDDVIDTNDGDGDGDKDCHDDYVCILIYIIYL